MRQAIYDFVYSSLLKAGARDGSADAATAISGKFFELIKQDVAKAEMQIKQNFSRSSPRKEELPQRLGPGSLIKRGPETSQEYHSRRMREMGIVK